MRFLILTCILATASPVAAQTDIQSLLYGPQPRTLKELGSSWFHMAVRDAGVQRPAGLESAFKSDESEYVCYTQGKTIQREGQTLLIAYRIKKVGPDSAKLTQLFATSNPGAQPGGNPFEMLFPKWTADTPLALVLLDMSLLAEASSIRPFALDAELAETDTSSASPSLVLAAILFPVFAQAREKARETSSLSNLKQLGIAAIMYCQDYDEVFPPMKDAATAKKALMPYVKADQIFIDPRTQQPYQPNTKMSKKQLAAIANPDRTVLFYEATVAPDGKRAVVFADGHAKRLSESEWVLAKSKSGIP